MPNLSLTKFQLMLYRLYLWYHGTQHNDVHSNDTQYNSTVDNDLLNVAIWPNMLSVVMPSVVILNVVALILFCYEIENLPTMSKTSLIDIDVFPRLHKQTKATRCQCYKTFFLQCRQ